jgi:hypothetical protein
MSARTTLVLALAAGFLGGIASQHITLLPVYAQSQTPIPKEIRAESFVIVDENGAPRGVFGIDKKDGPIVEITDSKGHAYRARFSSDGVAPFPHWFAKPSLVPPQ